MIRAGLIAISFVVAMQLGTVTFGQHHTVRFYAGSTPRRLNLVNFSPNSELLAVAVDSGPIVIVNTGSGDVIQEIDFRPHTMAFDPDSRHLLAIGDKETKRLDVLTGEAEATNREPPLGHLGIEFDIKNGKLLVSALLAGGPALKSTKIKVGDELEAILSAGKEKSALGLSVQQVTEALKGPPGTTVTLRFIPRSSEESIDVELRRAAARVSGRTVTFEDSAVIPRPEVAVVASRDSLVLMDAGTGQMTSAFVPVQVGQVGMNAVSADGSTFALVARRLRARDREPVFGLEIFDVATQKREHFALVGAESIRGIRLAPSGQRAYLGIPDRILVYDRAANTYTNPIEIGVDLQKAAAAKRRGKSDKPLIDVRPELTTDPFASFANVLMSFDVSPDENLVAVGSPDGQCSVWSTKEPKRLALVGKSRKDNGEIRFTTFSRDGKWLVFYVPGTLHCVAINDVLVAGSAADAPK